MPLYEYKCDACGERFELIQKYSEVTETCARCGKGPVHRLHSSPAIQFKGSGFYITDYTQKANTDYAQKGKSGGESASPEGGGKSDSAEKSEKGERGEKSERSEKGERGEKSETKKPDSTGGETSTKTESATSAAKTPAPPTKD